jgi:hypothetical protein
MSRAATAASVCLIVTPDAVEAPSLEEYLLKEVKPSGNILGTSEDP